MEFDRIGVDDLDRSGVDFSLLGPMVVAHGGETLPIGGLRQRSVLAALLIEADRSVEIDQLIEHVWHDAPPPKPVASLRAYIANLRRLLGDDVRLVTEAKGYRCTWGPTGWTPGTSKR